MSREKKTKRKISFEAAVNDHIQGTQGRKLVRKITIEAVPHQKPNLHDAVFRLQFVLVKNSQ